MLKGVLLMTMQIYLILSFSIVTITALCSFFVIYFAFKKENEKLIKLDVTLDQMKDMEDNISSFFEKNNIDASADIYKIAEILKVNIGEENDSLEVQTQLSEPDQNGNMFVTFKRGLKAQEKIFNFAHECAHIINGDPVPVSRPEGHNKPLIEQLADYTAAALLMPIQDVYNDLVSCKYKKMSTARRMKIVYEICNKYQVSEIIALRRIEEVCKLKKI